MRIDVFTAPQIYVPQCVGFVCMRRDKEMGRWGRKDTGERKKDICDLQRNVGELCKQESVCGLAVEPFFSGSLCLSRRTDLTSEPETK